MERFQKGIKRSRESWFKRVVHLFDRTTLDEALWDELEELLITADVGVSTTTKLIARVRERASREGLKDGHQIYSVLKEEMVAMLTLDTTGDATPGADLTSTFPHVVLVVGFNGSG